MRHDGLRNYLGQIELSLKQRSGVVPEQIVHDLHCRFADAMANRGGLQSDIDEHCLANDFGAPSEIALAHGDDPQPPDSGNAPGWRICCTACGRSSPAGRVGITRLGARSWHKYTAGRCRDCGRITSCRLIRDLDHVTMAGPIMDGQTPKQIRQFTHHPWKTVAAILTMVVVVNLGVLWLVFRN